MQSTSNTSGPLTPARSHSPASTEMFYSADEENDDNVTYMSAKSEVSMPAEESSSFQQLFLHNSSGDLGRFLLNGSSSNENQHADQHRDSTSFGESSVLFSPLSYLAENKDTGRLSAIYKSFDLESLREFKRENSHSTLNLSTPIETESTTASKTENENNSTQNSSLLGLGNRPNFNISDPPQQLLKIRRSKSLDSTASSDSSIWTTTSECEDNEILKVKNIKTEAYSDIYEPDAQNSTGHSAWNDSTVNVPHIQSIYVKPSIATLNSKFSQTTTSKVSESSPRSTFANNFESDTISFTKSLYDFRKNSTTSFETNDEDMHSAQDYQHSGDENGLDDFPKRDLTNTSIRRNISLKKRSSIHALQEFLKFNSTNNQKKIISAPSKPSANLVSKTAFYSSTSNFKDPKSARNSTTSFNNNSTELLPTNELSQNLESISAISDISAEERSHITSANSSILLEDNLPKETDSEIEENPLFKSNAVTVKNMSHSCIEPLSRVASVYSNSTFESKTDQSPQPRFDNLIHKPEFPKVLNVGESIESLRNQTEVLSTSTEVVHTDGNEKQSDSIDCSHISDSTIAMDSSSETFDSSNNKSSSEHSDLDYKDQPKSEYINYQLRDLSSSTSEHVEQKSQTPSLPSLPVASHHPYAAFLKNSQSGSSVSTIGNSASQIKNNNSSSECSNKPSNFSALEKQFAPKVSLSELDQMISVENNDDELYPFSSSVRQKSTNENAVYNLPGAPKIFEDRTILRQKSTTNKISASKEKSKPEDCLQRKEKAAKELSAQFSIALSRLPPLPGKSAFPASIPYSSSPSSPETPSVLIHDIDDVMADTPSTYSERNSKTPGYDDNNETSYSQYSFTVGNDNSATSSPTRNSMMQSGLSSNLPPFANGLRTSKRPSLGVYSATRPSSLAFSVDAESINGMEENKENMMPESFEKDKFLNSKSSQLPKDSLRLSQPCSGKYNSSSSIPQFPALPALPSAIEIQQYERKKLGKMSGSTGSQNNIKNRNSQVSPSHQEGLKEGIPASNVQSAAVSNILAKEEIDQLIEHGIVIENLYSLAGATNNRLSACSLPALPETPSAVTNNRLTKEEIDQMVENGDDVENLYPLAGKNSNRISVGTLLALSDTPSTTSCHNFTNEKIDQMVQDGGNDKSIYSSAEMKGNIQSNTQQSSSQLLTPPGSAALFNDHNDTSSSDSTSINGPKQGITKGHSKTISPNDKTVQKSSPQNSSSYSKEVENKERGLSTPGAINMFSDQLSEVLNFNEAEEKDDDVDISNIAFKNKISPSDGSFTGSSSTQIYHLPGAPKIFVNNTSPSNLLSPAQSRAFIDWKSNSGSVKSTTSSSIESLKQKQHETEKELAAHYELAVSRLPPLPGSETNSQSLDSGKFRENNNCEAIQAIDDGKREKFNDQDSVTSSVDTTESETQLHELHVRTQSSSSNFSSRASLTCSGNQVTLSALSITSSLTSTEVSDKHQTPVGGVLKERSSENISNELSTADNDSDTFSNFLFVVRSGAMESEHESKYASSKTLKAEAPFDLESAAIVLSASVPEADVSNVSHVSTFSQCGADGLKNEDSKFSYMNSKSKNIHSNNNNPNQEIDLNHPNIHPSITGEKSSIASKRSITKYFHRFPSSPIRSTHSANTVSSLKEKFLRAGSLMSSISMQSDNNTETCRLQKLQPTTSSTISGPPPKLPGLVLSNSLLTDLITSNSSCESFEHDPNTFYPEESSKNITLQNIPTKTEMPNETDTLHPIPHEGPDNSVKSHDSSGKPNTMPQNYELSHSRSSLSSFSSLLANPQQFFNSIRDANSKTSLRQPSISDNIGTNPGNTLYPVVKPLHKNQSNHQSAVPESEKDLFHNDDDDEAILANIRTPLPLEYGAASVIAPLSTMSENVSTLDPKYTQHENNPAHSRIFSESSSFYPATTNSDTIRNSCNSPYTRNTNKNSVSAHPSLPTDIAIPSTLAFTSNIQQPPKATVSSANPKSKSPQRSMSRHFKTLSKMSIGSEDEANLNATARAAQLIHSKRMQLDASHRSHYSHFWPEKSSDLADADHVSSSSGPYVDENGNVLCSPTMEWFMLIFFALFPLLWLLLAFGGFDRMVGTVSKSTKIIAGILSIGLFLIAIAGLIIGLAVGLTR